MVEAVEAVGLYCQLAVPDYLAIESEFPQLGGYGQRSVCPLSLGSWAITMVEKKGWVFPRFPPSLN
jgi:hypothetical protein